MYVRHLPTYRVFMFRLIDVLIVTAVGAGLAVTLPGCGGNRAQLRTDAQPNPSDLTAAEAAGQAGTDSASQSDRGISAEYGDIGLDLDSLKADLEYVNHRQSELSTRSDSDQALKTPVSQRQPIQWTQPDAKDTKNTSPNRNGASSTVQHSDGTTSAAMQAMTVGDDGVVADHAAAEDPGRTSVRAQDPATARSFSTSELIVMLAARLAQERSYSENDYLKYDLANAALLLVDPTRQFDPANLYNLSEDERKIVSAYQQHFLDLNSQLGSLADPSTLAQSTQSLADSLKPEETLRLSNLRLCTAVTNFGNYVDLEAARFLRGRRQEVIVYIEVDGFTSTYAAQDDLYHTTLTEKVDLYTAADGVVVYSLPAETVRDTCRRTRHDFYLVRRLVIPANLSLGDYRLKVHVRDETNAYEAEAVLPFIVVADAALVRAGQ